MAQPVLVVRDLGVSFFVDGSEVKAVDGLSFDLVRGHTLALVGESGCGKSVTALSLLGLVVPPGRIMGGSIEYEGHELVGAANAELTGLRGNRIAMIFQEPATALNPVMRVGDQVAEPLRVHRRLDKARARERGIELLAEVGIPAAAQRFMAYPHELSGGMRQRVVIAMALACEPAVLIADEPTTALDVTIQAQILALLRGQQRRRQVAMLFITHDLSLLGDFADEVAVMYAGRIVEQGSTAEILHSPRHPYTRGLLDSVPTRIHDGQSNATGRRHLPAIAGHVPNLAALPRGCAFRERCPRSNDDCAAEAPAFAGGVACFHPISKSEAS